MSGASSFFRTSKQQHETPVRSAQSILIESFWSGSRNGLAIPVRSAISPSKVPAALLPGLAIMECDRDEAGRERVHCKVAGTRFRQALGLELTGEDAEHSLTSINWSVATATLAIMRECPFGLWAAQELEYEGGRRLPTCMTLLPLLSQSNETSPDQLFCFLECNADALFAGHAPSFVREIRTLHRQVIDIGFGLPAALVRPSAGESSK